MNKKINEHTLSIAGLTRQLPICKISNELSIAAFVIFGDVEMTKVCAKELLALAPPFDLILTAESKGIPLAYEMSAESGKKYILARKGIKLYMQDVIEEKVKSISTDRIQTLYLDGKDVDLMKGKNVLIVDDVVSLGDSIRALEALVKRTEGKIAGKMTILAEGEAAERDDIIFLEKLPVF